MYVFWDLNDGLEQIVLELVQWIASASRRETGCNDRNLNTSGHLHLSKTCRLKVLVFATYRLTLLFLVYDTMERVSTTELKGKMLSV